MLFVRGASACCDIPIDDRKAPPQRMSRPASRRRPLSRTAKRRQLERQDHRCAYCNRSFGSWTELDGKLVRLVVHWDHAIPFSYAQDNRDANMVATCQVCNLQKGSMLFRHLDEARVFLQGRWAELLAAKKRP